MPLYTKYQKYRRMITNDGGQTWEPETPGIYRIGEIIENNSFDCGFSSEYHINEFGTPVELETLTKIKEITISHNGGQALGFLSSYNMPTNGNIMINRDTYNAILIDSDLNQTELNGILSINLFPLYDINGYVLKDNYLYYVNCTTTVNYMTPTIHKYNLTTLSEEVSMIIKKQDESKFDNNTENRNDLKNLIINDNNELELTLEKNVYTFNTDNLTYKIILYTSRNNYVNVTHFKNRFLSYHRYNSSSIYYIDKNNRTLATFNGTNIVGGLGVSSGVFMVEANTNVYFTDLTFFKAININANNQRHVVWADEKYMIIREYKYDNNLATCILTKYQYK